MNAKYPLAAALLMTATAALAQSMSAPKFGNLGNAPGGNFSFGAASGEALDDMVFKCSTSPFRPCTDAEKQQRQAVKQRGACPTPASQACVAFLMGSGAAPTSGLELLGSRPDVEWLDPVNCHQIPCRTKNSPGGSDTSTTVEEIVVTARRPAPQRQNQAPVPGDADFMGPVRPQDLPPAITPFKDDTDYEAAKATQQQVTPNQKIIDLGDRRYALLSEDGQTASIGGLCPGGNSCSSMPKPVDSIPGLQEKIKASQKNDGFTMTSRDNSKSVPTKDEAAADAPNPDGSSSPAALGGNLGRDLAALGGGNPGPAISMGNDSGGETSGTTKALPATEEMRAKMNQKGYSYNRIGEAADASVNIIQGGAATFDTTGGRSDDLHLNGRPAGLQAVANDGSAQ